MTCLVNFTRFTIFWHKRPYIAIFLCSFGQELPVMMQFFTLFPYIYGIKLSFLRDSYFEGVCRRHKIKVTWHWPGSFQDWRSIIAMHLVIYATSYEGSPFEAEYLEIGNFLGEDVNHRKCIGWNLSNSWRHLQRPLLAKLQHTALRSQALCCGMEIVALSFISLFFLDMITWYLIWGLETW